MFEKSAVRRHDRAGAAKRGGAWLSAAPEEGPGGRPPAGSL